VQRKLPLPRRGAGLNKIIQLQHLLRDLVDTMATKNGDTVALAVKCSQANAKSFDQSDLGPQLKTS